MSIDFDANAALAQVQQLVNQHGQDALNAAIAVERVNALDNFTGVIGWGLLCGVFIWMALRAKRYGNERDDDWYIPMGICFAVATAFAIATLCCLLNVWMWVGLFNPKLALAHDIINRVTK